MGKIKGKFSMDTYKFILLSVVGSVLLLAGINSYCENKSFNMQYKENYNAYNFVIKQGINLPKIKTKKCNILNPNRKRTC